VTNTLRLTHPAAPSWPGLTDAALTDVGLVRRSNEDAFLSRSEAGLWVVADGMGGHEDGEWAAAAIVRALDGVSILGEFDADCAGVARGVQIANATICQRADAYRLRMGSTVAALLLGDDRFAVFWAGDSRAYRLRDGTLSPLTTDHTQVQAKVASGELTATEARNHPMAHVLSRAVGVEPDLDLSSAGGEVRAGDVFLLCSDGLHGTLSEPEIAAVLAQAEPAEACERLVARCRTLGAPDNVTVVVVSVGG
jgi:serine/threonine-protein phosphatase Stp1